MKIIVKMKMKMKINNKEEKHNVQNGKEQYYQKRIRGKKDKKIKRYKI